MKQDIMLRRFLKFLLISLIIVAASLQCNIAFADVVTYAGNKPVSVGEYTPIRDDSNYEEADNTYDDGDVKFYLATHDKGKKDLTNIQYKGKEYQLAGVLYQADDEFNFNTATASDGQKVLAYNGPESITVFFDDGRYTDSVSVNYTCFSRSNNSYVGINKDTNNEPTAIISKASRIETNTTPAIAGLIERNIINRQNIYFENLKFDGQNRDMIPVSYKQNGKTKKYRGEYLFNITGEHKRMADGLVMRDIVIENIGDQDKNNDGSFSFFGPDTRRKNVAINVHYNPGKVNLENITIRNIKTVTKYGVMQIQDGDATYVRNVNIDMQGAGEETSPVKMETTTNFTALEMTQQKSVVMGLTASNVSDSGYDHIYVQDYRYDSVKVSTDYNYAVWSVNNGSYYSSAFEIFKTRRPMEENRAVQDLRDNYWVVDTSSPISVEKQMEAIGRVVDYTAKGVNSPKSPRANIKFIGNTVPSFVIPNQVGRTSLWKDQNGSDMEVNIVAVKSFDVLANEAVEMVPTVKDFKGEFKNTGKINLYNMDFKTISAYTAEEVNNDISPFQPMDINDGRYPQGMNSADYTTTKKAAITKAGEIEYHNCNFVGLVSKLNGTLINNIEKGGVANISIEVKNDETYTTSMPGLKIKSSLADDPTVFYTSSDENVAKVNDEGVVTTINPGRVKIYAKAKDIYNDGEIEKPFQVFEVNVTVKGKYKFESVDANPLPKEVTDLLPQEHSGLSKGDFVTPTEPQEKEVELDSGKWVFQGYEPKEATVEHDSLEFIGRWKFEKNNEEPDDNGNSITPPDVNEGAHSDNPPDMHKGNQMGDKKTLDIKKATVRKSPATSDNTRITQWMLIACMSLVLTGSMVMLTGRRLTE